MYVVELSIRLSPMPIAVQRKDLEAAQKIYREVLQVLDRGEPKWLELSCEKDEHKRISVLSAEIISIQIYEKSAASGGGKRPGFSVDS